MAYDEELVERIRDALDGQVNVTEMRMFGGVAFLVGGNMAIAASGQGGALVRVDPVDTDHLLESTGAEVAVMNGRPMTGWLRIPSAGLLTTAQTAMWARLGADYARSLPAKT